MSTVLQCQDSRFLEFRPPNTGTLHVFLAQAKASRSSDLTLEYQVLTNGRPASVHTLAFGQTADVVLPLGGVDAVTIRVEIAGKCGGSVTAFVTLTIVQT